MWVSDCSPGFAALKIKISFDYEILGPLPKEDVSFYLYLTSNSVSDHNATINSLTEANGSILVGKFDVNGFAKFDVYYNNNYYFEVKLSVSVLVTIYSKWSTSLTINKVLPEPGVPIIKILWPPAAAISKAFLAFFWPLTSLKSNNAFCSEKFSLNIKYVLYCFCANTNNMHNTINIINMD